ncbi:MAG: hypothetical protein ABIF11_09910, partial [Nitrospirota bacterium]
SQYEIFNWLNGYKGNWEITISLNCPAKDVGHAKSWEGLGVGKVHSVKAEYIFSGVIFPRRLTHY